MLNSKNLQDYNKLKTKKDFKKLEKEDIDNLINKKYGTRSFFENLIAYLKNKKTYTISESIKKN